MDNPIGVFEPYRVNVLRLPAVVYEQRYLQILRRFLGKMGKGIQRVLLQIPGAYRDRHLLFRQCGGREHTQKENNGYNG